MPNTVPNQRLITIHRERAASDFLGIKTVIGKLRRVTSARTRSCFTYTSRPMQTAICLRSRPLLSGKRWECRRLHTATNLQS